MNGENIMEVIAVARPRTTRHIGPSLTCPDVARRLGYSEQWVAGLANKAEGDPDRLNAYYQEGGRWILKPPGKLATKTWPNRPLFFYEDDVKEWEKTHPLKAGREHIDYSEEEKHVILEAVNNGWYTDHLGNNYPLREKNGTVKRGELMRYLNKQYGYGKWRTNTYGKIRQILEDAGIPTPAPKSASRRMYIHRVPFSYVQPEPINPKPDKFWLVKFFNADGTLREEVQRYSKLKPLPWVKRHLGEGETFSIEEIVEDLKVL